ncbi:MAG: ribonuclease H-like domain-containing protein [Deltaproteobacteria bacterium]|nr:ribonuclease H-like domain-containing protein [Deltaproteobacteria bacterium]
MIRATFQLLPGVGAGRERALWAAGFLDWATLAAAQDKDVPLPAALMPAMREALAFMEAAWHAQDLVALASRIPQAEHWRLFAQFAPRAVYVDIEVDPEEGVTVVGVLDEAGPKLLLAGRSLSVESLEQHIPPDCLLVTFNGSSFDVPVLTKKFDLWPAPAAHMDLRHVWNKLGFWGGLKSLEDEVGIGRPQHIKDLDGSHAAWLWRHFCLGDRAALLKLVEYNLYDTVNLRTLAAMGFNRMAHKCGFSHPPLPVSQRGDVLYDVSRLLLSL